MNLKAVSFCLIFFVMLAFVTPGGRNDAFAFEADGFKNGMSRNEVALALKYFTKVQIAEPSSLTAIDTNGYKSSFDLCNGSLVSIQLTRNTDFKTFVKLVREYVSKYGQPVLSNDDNQLEPMGVIDAVGLRWKVDEEYVSYYYTSYPKGDILRVFYQSPNSCFKFPR